MGCDFPEHHKASGGFDWWLVFLAAVVAAGLAGLYLLWTALGSPVAAATVIAGLVWLTVGTCLVRAVVGAIRATPRWKPIKVATPIADAFVEEYYVPGMVVSETRGPVDVPDELAVRRARRVA